MIACELGQTTNGDEIRRVSGSPGEMAGGAHFDWPPEDEKRKPPLPAWMLLNAAHVQSNIIPLLPARA